MFSQTIARGVLAAALVLLATDAAKADVFGEGVNQFTVDFVSVSGATNPTSGYGIVNNDYRMGTYEIANDQWNKFTVSLGVSVTGTPLSAYNASFHDWYMSNTTSVPTNNVSWYEAAQFVNWLNTNTGHQPAYRFTGTQGSSDYALATWSAGEAANGSNFYRHKDAFYFLPTEDEWVKAAYWNGTTLQSYATKAGESLTQGHGTSGTGWNYYNGVYAVTPYGPWAVGNGSQELNGTYDMMGNVSEFMESPYTSGDHATGSSRVLRGGDWSNYPSGFLASNRYSHDPTDESSIGGFRVASVPLVPGDTNGDNHVDQEDAAAVAAHWGQSGGWADGDFNDDGQVNAVDASILAANWGYGPSESGTVPEPDTWALLVGLALGLLKGNKGSEE